MRGKENDHALSVLKMLHELYGLLNRVANKHRAGEQHLWITIALFDHTG